MVTAVWPRRRGRGRRRVQDGPVASGEGLQAAQAAVEAQERRLAATARKTPEIRALGQLLRELRLENHFAERVNEMLTRPDPGNGHVNGG